MSGFSNVLKNGWHPDKDKDFKSQVTGIWKKDNNDYETRANHVSRPLSSLRDPDSFGPPPRHVALGGGASPGGTAAMAQRPSTHSPPHSSAHSQHAPATPARPSVPSRLHAAAAVSDGEDDRPRSPQPFRMDTTGLSTSNLPPPPTRKDGSGISRSPVPAAPAVAPKPAPKPAIKAAPPGLPPRLPPRSTPSPNPPSYHSATSTSAHPPPPPRVSNTGSSAGADPYINQDAVNRLGRAGISVPGLGIGAPPGNAQHQHQHQQPTALSAIHTLAASSNANTATSAARATPSPRQASPSGAQTVNQAPPTAQLGELQARFVKMGTGTGVESSRTLSRSPARPAVERSSAAASLVAGKKKPPPPPPAKKPGLAAVAEKPHYSGRSNVDDDDGDDGSDDHAPPPIPMSTRPQGW
ncbi:hypothetical protein SCUCBS95973_002541 [Sporothrix curviconia]|uniref:Uncharacterized protein n=1 Tax=Sporothrix curviconia TaxID=1260050 RepID=A0ABP0B7T6_9PEZI